METFDDIQIHRPELARGYLELLTAQPGRPIALFAPRRVGKTFFLDHDLRSAAKLAGYVTVYADLWLNKKAPLLAINHVLEEALDDVTVPGSSVGKVALTPVRKIGALGASLELGDEPKRRPLPEVPELRLDSLLARLAGESGRRILLMLDEIQALGDAPDGDAIVATLRAVFQNRKDTVFAVFTGSSQEALSSMMVASGGPMYQFAQLLDFPVLGDEYLERLCRHFERVHHNKRLDLDALRRVFEQIGFKPALMKDLVKSMSADGLTDVDGALQRLSHDEKQVAGWRALLSGLPPFDRAILIGIARGHPPLGRENLRELDELTTGSPATISKVRSALDRLHKTGILVKPQGTYAISDPLLSSYLAGLDIRSVMVL
ncbi:MAG: hypothetical protein ABSF50_17345 [Burkholderiaceae bacterium]